MQIYLSLSSKDKQSLLKIVGNKHAHTLERFFKPIQNCKDRR